MTSPLCSPSKPSSASFFCLTLSVCFRFCSSSFLSWNTFSADACSNGSGTWSSLSRSCQHVSNTSHSTPTCRLCLLLYVQSRQAAARFRLGPETGHAQCRRRGGARTSAPLCPATLNCLTRYQCLPGVSVSTERLPNWSQLLRTPMSFRPSRKATMSFSRHLLVRSERLQRRLYYRRRAHSLSVRSRSCAAVVNI